MDVQKVVGTNIKNIRESQKLSQEKLASLADLDRTYIFSIEKGRRNISINVLFKISKALNVSIHELVKNIEDEL
jgi:transcriptional regulator with XRE-family HTH domain